MQTVVFSTRVGINSLKHILKLLHFISANRSFVTIFFNQRIATPSIAASVPAVIWIVKKHTVYDMAWLITCHFVHQLQMAVAGG
jgi:cell division protein FtsX